MIWNPGGLSELENRVDNYITRHGLLKPNRTEPLPHTTEVQGGPGGSTRASGRYLASRRPAERSSPGITTVLCHLPLPVR